MNCLVRHTREAHERRSGIDATAVRAIFDQGTGCEHFTMELLRTVRGRGAQRSAGHAEELLFVLSGHGQLVAGNVDHALEPQTGALLSPGARYELANDDEADLVVVAVSLPEPERGEHVGVLEPRLSRLRDHAAQAATADRTFRIVFDAEHGCHTATQFVGEIPVGAAPPHYHLYDEVIYVLEGNGVMHMDGAQTPVHAGSAIQLPARELHTLANSGPDIMRVLGIFRPEGSPAEAYYPDGTPAQYGAEDAQSAPVTT